MGLSQGRNVRRRDPFERHKSGVNTSFQQDKSDDENIVRRHYDFLVDRVSPEFGLVDKLYSNQTLSYLEKSKIEAESPIPDRNEILLGIVIKKSSCKELLEALKMCGQSHLIKYLEEDGVYKSEFGGNWPLEQKESTVLLKNYETLVDLLDSHDLVRLLYETGVVNMRQMDLVSSSRWTNAEQNKVLLEILRKGSLDSYWQTIRCLHLSNQSHIARIFESGGVVIRIDANLQIQSSNLTEVENSIATEITSLLRHTSLSDASRIWEEVQLSLVGAAATHSVSLYFLCSYQGDIDYLRQMACGGQLRQVVEDIFNRLMEYPTRIEVMLKWSRHLFSKSQNNYIKAIQVKNFINEPMQTTIQCLPLELLDTILLKAYLWSRVSSGAMNGDKDSNIVAFLASPDELWFQRILRKRFKKTIWSQLEKMYRAEFGMYLGFRGCLRYLEEIMQVEEVGLTKRDLADTDFVTDLQNARLLRKAKKKGKRRRRSVMLANMVEEILSVKRGFEEECIYNNFIRCLHRTKQTAEARVLEDGGATAKVVIRQPSGSKIEAWSREFSSKLNNFKERTRLTSAEQENIIQQLEDSDLEILKSGVDRNVTVWIWCKSQSAEESLEDLYKSGTLIDHLYRLAEETDQTRDTKDVHLEELSQLETDKPTRGAKFSLRSLVINVEGELRIEEDFMRAIAVTKLKNKIFVLSRSLSYSLLRVSVNAALHIFDDQHPFRLQRKMLFEEIKETTDLFSFEKNFCLYVNDIQAKCLWKICPPDEDKIEDGEFTCRALTCPALLRFTDFRMSITDEGQILIIGDRDPILLFYESESALNSPIRIDLPADIKEPFQVAENSVGNFIFLHRTPEYNSSGNADKWAVSEVDRTGKTIIRQQCGIGNQWLSQYRDSFLLVDPKDRIFLADRNNHRLILLDSRLRHVHSFRLDTDEENVENRLATPMEMFYDGGNNQLIVVGKEKVLAYTLHLF